jgi:hypothetical protein
MPHLSLSKLRRARTGPGRRLARACAATVYGKPGPFTGPTITGCTKAGNTITITFNASLMVGDALEIQPYNASVAGASQMAVLVNATNFCFQQGKDKPGALASTGHPAPVQPCWFDGFNKVGSAAGVTDEKADWVQVDIKPGSAPHSVDVDLTKAGGKAFGIREPCICLAHQSKPYWSLSLHLCLPTRPPAYLVFCSHAYVCVCVAGCTAILAT